ncbi:MULTISPECIES: protein-glutamine gamma-glutamyltransferase [Brevibacillus]|jgi:protein-glutamine gamma-glutamyltransferase|uniref:Protein-glutamine gamma-glutamyltransferase n=1 Tax=Brevibacillus parabrevis TaxID=54914 RepID=A0A4Y3PEV8_BREPA|nr:MULTISPECIES: protein-glutamine gamma-glutamyltransferase [Brevibacillus]MBU8715116.1 protein-glutamine gamma-glutamyltransferase [Brevibacillus parabrevis]MDH6352441.1 protein-glutamine gamma-glutamyltransferase [Brevibacillus sp. 1238]MDR4999949.1 protein-glutamine gamma-glutamyltransferase [Brevibacillus parabrevis]MED1725592.1 protein-glutamine gamma-glutamyltransferase [Brevibacillus parabrevis]NRQ54925.1 protein-glutamine gamma-glutamyltransferase [Brevibacillus sp. HD1.4A]
MLIISGRQANPAVLADEWGLNRVQREVVQRMAASGEEFVYPSPELLQFELKMRDHLVRSAIALYESGIAFSTFENSRANPVYWDRTELGGFRLRTGVPPSQGIINIFQEGRKYATECATAMVIILYHAVLQSIRREDFERMFADILLYDWRYDQDLDLRTTRTTTFLPGDILYFANPDHNPDKPQWQGENAVDLGRGMYYGHGAGIRDAESMIEFLNEQRRYGATRSAYLVPQATRPGFAYLFPYDNKRPQVRFEQQAMEMSSRITARIGSLFWEW